jgi:hypothetical protein
MSERIQLRGSFEVCAKKLFDLVESIDALERLREAAHQRSAE